MVLLVGHWLCFNDFTNWSRVQRRAVWRTTEVLVPGGVPGDMGDAMQRLTIKPDTEYGDLVTICEVRLAYKSPSPTNRKRVFLCRCSCGREVPVRLDHLRSGHTQSCGQCGLEHNGQRKTLKAWAESIGVAESTLRARLKVMGLGEALARK